MTEPIVIGHGHWLFESASFPGEYHVVDSELGCSCPSYFYLGRCWHWDLLLSTGKVLPVERFSRLHIGP